MNRFYCNFLFFLLNIKLYVYNDVCVYDLHFRKYWSEILILIFKKPFLLFFAFIIYLFILCEKTSNVPYSYFALRYILFHLFYLQAYDQKNIRRRVYDALNVLMAMNIISKEKKEIKWLGLPTNSAQEYQNLEVCLVSYCLFFPFSFLLIF